MKPYIDIIEFRVVKLSKFQTDRQDQPGSCSRRDQVLLAKQVNAGRESKKKPYLELVGN